MAELVDSILDRPLRAVGRCELFAPIARGGFGSVHLGRQVGASGFSRIVAIKRLHGTLLNDAEAVAMFLDEARVVARIRHPNVVQTLDLVEEDGELFIIMEYVEGVPLNLMIKNLRAKGGARLPLPVIGAVMQGALTGLQAAHMAKNAKGEQLDVIHRDMSPDNVMVGVDGFARLVDFGIARAVGQSHSTERGNVKGKLAYLSPEQVQSEPLSRQTDLFAASLVIWQMLTGERMFKGANAGQIAYQVCHEAYPRPSDHAPGIPPSVEEVVMKGLAREPTERWESAKAMSEALVTAIGEIASPAQVGDLVTNLCADFLATRSAQVAAVENAPHGTIAVSSQRNLLSLPGRPSHPDVAPPIEAPPPEAAPPAATTSTSTKITSSFDHELPLTPRPWTKGALVVGALLLGALVAIFAIGDDPAEEPPTPAASAPAEPTATATAEPTASATATATATASASATSTAAAATKPKPKPRPKIHRPRPTPKPKPSDSVYSRE